MIRKAVALALAGMVCLSGPALAADAQASATKAAKVAKVDALQRAAAQKGADNLTGDPDFLIFLAFGLISTAVIVSAFNNDDTPVSP